MVLSESRVESRRRDLERRSENAERLGGGVELGVGGRVGVAHLDVGQLKEMAQVTQVLAMYLCSICNKLSIIQVNLGEQLFNID